MQAPDSYGDVELSATLEKSLVEEPAVSPPAQRAVYVYAALTLTIVLGTLIAINSELVSLGIMLDLGVLIPW